MSDIKRTITPNDPADFTPNREPQIPLQPFRYWCQKVLPLVYDDSISYYELLCKVLDFLNKTMEDVNNLDIDVENLLNAYKQLQNYVNVYFDSLDVQEEINNKLDQMAQDGTLKAIISGWVIPEMYGAVGDGVTDDYAAFQAMFDGIVDGTQIVLNKQNYYISAPLILNKNFVRFSGQFNMAEYTPAIIFSFKDGVVLTVNGAGVSFSNIAIRSDLQYTPTTETTTGILFNRDNPDADGNIDAAIYNCLFMRISTAIDIRGRNVTIKNTTFTENRTAVLIENVNTVTEQRGFIIDGCRFHYGILGVSNNMRVLRENSLFITNCFADGMQQFFNGLSCGVTISNNYFTTMIISSGSYISLKGSETYDYMCNILNNYFEASGKNQCIYANNTVKSIVISNNTFLKSIDSAILIDGLNTGHLCIVKGNSFVKCAEQTENPITRFTRAAHGAIISNVFANTKNKDSVVVSEGIWNSQMIHEPNYQVLI